MRPASQAAHGTIVGLTSDEVEALCAVARIPVGTDERAAAEEELREVGRLDLLPPSQFDYLTLADIDSQPGNTRTIGPIHPVAPWDFSVRTEQDEDAVERLKAPLTRDEATLAVMRDLEAMCMRRPRAVSSYPAGPAYEGALEAVIYLKMMAR